MKIAVVGMPDFPQGKKPVIDERLSTLEPIIKPSKTTYISVELLGPDGLVDADGIICEQEAKLDLIVSDLEAVETRLNRVTDEAEQKMLMRFKEVLEKNSCLFEVPLTDEEKKVLHNSQLTSMKPVYFVDAKKSEAREVILFNAYGALGMQSFITGAKDKELRAWSIKKGATALEAAGAIHSDIQRGFIKAEIIGYGDLVKAGSIIGAKHSMHLEDKTYVMQDGDYVVFRFNV